MKIRYISQCFSLDEQLLSRIRYIMKITTVLITCVLLSIVTMAYPQRITVNLKNASLKVFFEEIQKQTDIALLFPENIVVNKKITIHEKNMILIDLLEKELPKFNLDYKLFNGQITIFPRTEAKSIGTQNQPKNTEQETVSVRGRIFNMAEPPIALENVNIAIKAGKTVGSTDKEGYYSISVPKGTYIIFTAVGYHSREVFVNKDESNLTISLKENVADVEEVVVVGMTEMQKKHIHANLILIS